MNQPLSATLSEIPKIADSAKVHACNWGRWVEVGERCILNNVEMGDYSYIQNDSDLMFTKVGKFTSIASSVRINPSNHPWWRPTLHHFTYRPGKFGLAEDPAALDQEIFDWREQDRVEIGHDVWIGHGAILLPGIKVGNGAIIGAGSVVTKDVPAWSIVVGNPAKVLRERFADPSFGPRLDAIAWWNWSDQQIAAALPLFQKDTGEFLSACEADGL
ncbi:DapH/DapD/GlmU-related protein [Aliagarivorans taiwanensis]|uniref:DapH/DapD/GlmU-related protein n=1 Tax=Aliagarivorans taiwanensis TaxID=561966 RepID=UPI0004080856|nr:DapH/DapD/GlmU-related protein [Aliagarivorans taiwanensis]